MQRRILKMYNNSKLTVTVKCSVGAKGVQTSLMLQLMAGASTYFIIYQQQYYNFMKPAF